MSLINPKNVVAPLQNPVHLVSILLVTILFFVYRLSGGAITPTQVPTAPPIPDRRNALEGLLKSADAPAPPNVAADAPKAAPPRPANDILNELTQKLDGKKGDPSGAAGKDGKRPGALGDIEKTLGLRQ